MNSATAILDVYRNARKIYNKRLGIYRKRLKIYRRKCSDAAPAIEPRIQRVVRINFA